MVKRRFLVMPRPELLPSFISSSDLTIPNPSLVPPVLPLLLHPAIVSLLAQRPHILLTDVAAPQTVAQQMLLHGIARGLADDETDRAAVES